jgi:hypothetical protein
MRAAVSSTSALASKRRATTDGFGASPTPATQSSIATFVATARQQQNVCKNVARFFFKNNVAEALIEDPDIVHAFAELGVVLPTRKVLGGSMLDDEYKAIKKQTEDTRMDAAFYAISTDGWRRKYAEGGTPLINVMALLPDIYRDGGSQFVKIIPAAGVTKDSQWVAQLHMQLAEEMEPDDISRILGFIMDNTSTNANLILHI